MPSTDRENLASAHVQQLAAAPNHGPGEMGAPHPQLTAVQESPVPPPPAAHESADRPNRALNRLVGVALTILTLLLAAVMFHAGVNVEVLV